MNKRAFLEGFLTASTVAFGGQFMWQRMQRPDTLRVAGTAATGAAELARSAGSVAPPGTLTRNPAEAFAFTPLEIDSTQPARGIPRQAPTLERPIAVATLSDQQVDSYLRKIRNFDAVFASDIFLDPSYEALLLKTTAHMARVESYMGHGNFNLMSFDEMLVAGRNFPAIGPFESDELNFLEEVFFANPNRYGFFGKKISHSLTEVISRQDVAKIARTGHFLWRGESFNLYNRLKQDVGHDLVLTSGVRSVVKQMHLFLAKAVEANGNLSRASRSLAPPGHSYHGVGDFDIGKIGFGARNFTADFSSTDEYRKIANLGYVDIRYPTDNLFGVRFEPWHIKIA
ncbi:MAG: M15 family metallopeptidase [Gammaproteobacteria bacterium]